MGQEDKTDAPKEQQATEVEDHLKEVPMRWPGIAGWLLVLASLCLSAAALVALPDMPDELFSCPGNGERIDQIVQQSHSSVLLAMAACLVAFLALLPRYRYWIIRQGATFIAVLPVLLGFAWALGFANSFYLVLFGIPALLLLAFPMYLILNRRYHKPPHEKSVRPTFAANLIISLLMAAPIFMLLAIPQPTLGC